MEADEPAVAADHREDSGRMNEPDRTMLVKGRNTGHSLRDDPPILTTGETWRFFSPLPLKVLDGLVTVEVRIHGGDTNRIA